MIVRDFLQVIELWYCLKSKKVLSSSKLQPEVLPEDVVFRDPFWKIIMWSGAIVLIYFLGANEHIHIPNLHRFLLHELTRNHRCIELPNNVHIDFLVGSGDILALTHSIQLTVNI